MCAGNDSFQTFSSVQYHIFGVWVVKSLNTTRCGSTCFLALGRLSQENHEFEVCLFYLMRPCCEIKKVYKQIKIKKLSGLILFPHCYAIFFLLYYP